MNIESKVIATTKPMICITTNIGTDAGAMPAKESLKLRAMVTAGFASEVDDVNQYAPPIHTPTATGTESARGPLETRKMTSRSPTVATTSPSQILPPSLTFVDRPRTSTPNIRFAIAAPTIPPIVWTTA